MKHDNTTGHAHELTFSCYHRYNYLEDPQACDLFLAELNGKSRKLAIVNLTMEETRIGSIIRWEKIDKANTEVTWVY